MITTDNRTQSSTEITVLNNKPIVMAQISDSHLFSDPEGLHHGHHVLSNLKSILSNIGNNPAIDYLVFTGDLTQDHSEQSYQNFVNAVHECQLGLPIYYLAGNHDETELLTKYFSAAPFCANKTINHLAWQIQLIDSKSATPAGYVSEAALTDLNKAISGNKHQLLMMHHHPVDIGYFIDKHGLQNKADFWQAINKYDNINGIACGHVHHGKKLSKQLGDDKPPLSIYTCPATSIQFDPSVDGVAALAKGPGYRVFYLYADGELHSDVVYL